MAGFCKHCGKELKDDEPYCPECGMPTGSSLTPQPAYTPKKKGNGVAIAIIVIIIALSILMIALIPMLIDNGPTEKYTMTVTVNGFNIDVTDTTQYTDIASDCKIVLSLSYNYGEATISDLMVLDDHYNLSSVYKNVNVKSSVKITGNPEDVRITAFLIITGPGWITYNAKTNEYEEFFDYIDIYSIDTSKITSGSSKYYGESGIIFSLEDLDKDNKVRLYGDSDPKGIVDVTITTVKIQ